MNKNKKLILIISIVILIIVIIYVMLLTNKNDSVRFKQEYEKYNDKLNNDGKYINISINKNNKMKYINSNEIKNIIDNKDSAVLYVGTANCQYCRTVAEVLTETVRDSKLTEAYYYKNDSNKSDYNEFVNLFKDELKNNNKMKEPIVIFIIDGEVASYKIGTIYSHKNANEKLDTSGIEGLKAIYNSGINLVLKAKELKKLNNK